MARVLWLSVTGLAVVWLVLVWVGLNYRPLMPIDETRYLSVAWDMWLNGDWLVPQLNGRPYPYKTAAAVLDHQSGLGRVSGSVKTWPRLVAPLFGAAGLAAAWFLARRLWPRRTMVPWP